MHNIICHLNTALCQCVEIIFRPPTTYHLIAFVRIYNAHPNHPVVCSVSATHPPVPNRTHKTREHSAIIHPAPQHPQSPTHNTSASPRTPRKLLRCQFRVQNVKPNARATHHANPAGPEGHRSGAATLPPDSAPVHTFHLRACATVDTLDEPRETDLAKCDRELRLRASSNEQQDTTTQSPEKRPGIR